MGKRELLLIGAFLLMGIGVYHVTAPPPTPGREGFSFRRLVGWIRTEVQGENAAAPVARTLVRKVDPDVDRLVLPELFGTVRVIGEARDDISVELKAVAFGLDDTAARARAQEITLTLDEAHDGSTTTGPTSDAGGDSGDDEVEKVKVKVLKDRSGQPEPTPQAKPGASPGAPPGVAHAGRKAGRNQWTLRVGRPRNGRRPTYELTLRVPARLACTLGFRGEADVRGVAEVRFMAARGKAIIRDVGLVTGDFVGGAVEVLSAREVGLKTQRTEVRLERVDASATLDVSRGSVRARHLRGPLTARLERTECDAEGLNGPATFKMEGGRLTLRGIVAPVEITGHRTGLELTMTTAVAVTATTSGDELALELPIGGLVLDAHTEDGRIRVSDDRLTVTSSEGEQTLAAAIGGGGPLVRLRNERADIVIRGGVESVETVERP